MHQTHKHGTDINKSGVVLIRLPHLRRPVHRGSLERRLVYSLLGLHPDGKLKRIRDIFHAIKPCSSDARKLAYGVILEPVSIS